MQKTFYIIKINIYNHKNNYLTKKYVQIKINKIMILTKKFKTK